VSMTVVMRARAGEGGVILATNDIIRPTKTVFSAPDYPTPDVDGGIAVLNGNSRTYTYTIRLERLSPEGPAELDAVYDILPKGFAPASSNYVVGSSKLKVDNGDWVAFPAPLREVDQNQWRFRWPASGVFDATMRTFEVRQVKEIQFQITGALPTDQVHYNWVVLKPWNTLSGAIAPITVGSPTSPKQENAMLEVTKTSDPDFVQPGVPTPVRYNITINNLDVNTRKVQQITDYLPPGFTYTGPTTGLTVDDPIPLLEEVSPGVFRWRLRWTKDEFPNNNAVSIAGGGTATMAFWVLTSQEVSGSYYNEVIVIPDGTSPKIFENIGVRDSAFLATYSWNTGTVLVPFYDSRADADEVVIDANLGFVEGGGIAIKSWQVY